MALQKNDPDRALQFFEDKLSFTTGPVELSKAMKDGSVNVVDVRGADDFAKEHIPGSVSLPEADWASMRGVDPSKLNVLLCYSEVCHLAARAAVELARAGVPVMEMQGGFAAWKAHNLPVESGEQAQDAVERARKYLEARREAERAAEASAKGEEKKGEEKKGEEKVEAKVEEKVEAKGEEKVEAEGEEKADAQGEVEVEEKAEEKVEVEAKGEEKGEAEDEKVEAEGEEKVEADANGEGAGEGDVAAEEPQAEGDSPVKRPRRQPAPAR